MIHMCEINSLRRKEEIFFSSVALWKNTHAAEGWVFGNALKAQLLKPQSKGVTKRRPKTRTTGRMPHNGMLTGFVQPVLQLDI